MSSSIQFKRGTRAQIDALALKGGLLEGEPLFITDENRMAIASNPTNFYSASRYMDEDPIVAYQGRFNTYTSTSSNFNPSLDSQIIIGFSVNSGLSRLTAQYSGLYYVQAMQLVNSAAVSCYLQTRKNGVNIHHAYTNNDDSYDMTTSCIVQLSVNDYVDFYYQGSITYAWGGVHSSVSVFRISD